MGSCLRRNKRVHGGEILRLRSELVKKYSQGTSLSMFLKLN